VGSQDWDVFGATATCEPRLGGLVNVEEIAMPERGVSGVSLRSFDLATGLWSIWWISSLEGRLRPPVTGGFENGVGLFEGDDLDDDRPSAPAMSGPTSARARPAGPRASRWTAARPGRPTG
jgi:hypothetical protein